jgi:putative oxidoreductase
MATQTRTEYETLDPAGRHAPDPVGRHAHWLLRFVLASVFLYTGIDKFMGGGIGEFAQMIDGPVFMALLVALAELGGGTLIIVGGLSTTRGDLLTRLGALMILPVMFGAIFMVHWGQWHFMATQTHPMGGMMMQVSLVMVALYLMIKGNRA